MVVNASLTAINAIIDLLSIGPLFTLKTLQNMLQIVGHVTLDMPPDEAAQPLQMTLHKILWIDILSNPEAIRMTHFSHVHGHGQLDPDDE
jgi:hypothetical protein